MEFDVQENFWVAHPDMVAAGPFGGIHKKDKTRGKDQSSRLAWTVKLIWDRRSTYYNLPETGPDNKIDLLFEDFYGNKGYYKKNLQLVEELRDFYLRISETTAMRTLRGIEDKLLERDTFLRKTPYDMGEIGEKGSWVGGTVDTLDKMMANTEKVYALLEKARKAVSDEMEQTVMGDQIQSLSDKGEL